MTNYSTRPEFQDFKKATFFTYILTSAVVVVPLIELSSLKAN